MSCKRSALLLLFWLCLVFILIRWGLILIPERHGDGLEYALQLEAFSNHFSPAIQANDAVSLTHLTTKFYSREYAIPLLDQINKMLLAGDNSVYGIVIKSFSGQYYALHFWFYALANLPAKLFLKYAGLNELKAFQLTNALLIIGAIGYVLFFSRQSSFTRLFLSALFLLSGTLYYFKWGHPEIYSAALVLIAVIACLDKRYRLCVLCAALGSLQNPPIALMIPFIIISIFYGNQKLSIKDFIKQKPLYLATLLMVSSLSLLPAVFYYINFGKLNLVVQYSTDYKNANIVRFFSFFLDLNQGMIVAIPGVFIGAVIIILYRIGAMLKNKIFLNAFLFYDVLILLVITMVIPCLVQTNWNAGCSIFMRYAYWAQVPLLVWLTVGLETGSKKLRHGLASIIFCIQLTVSLFFGSLALNQYVEDYLNMKSYVDFIFDKVPWLYNPEPEIFIERTLRHEISSRGPVRYLNNKGIIRKILLFKEDIVDLNTKICGPDGVLLDGKSNQEVSAGAVNLGYRFRGRECGYLSGEFYCVRKQPCATVSKNNKK